MLAALFTWKFWAILGWVFYLITKIEFELWKRKPPSRIWELRWKFRDPNYDARLIFRRTNTALPPFEFPFRIVRS